MYKSLKSEIEFTYFDIRNYYQPLHSNDPDDDIKLLDKGFYSELLHIMGLSESIHCHAGMTSMVMFSFEVVGLVFRYYPSMIFI